jgi:predicted dehydrogenase
MRRWRTRRRLDKEHDQPSPDFELAAIVDVSADALQKAGEESGVPTERRFASLQEALDAVEADAVLSVTPPAVHVEHARLAFARGLHLMTEKPIADTMPNALEMVRLARESGKQLVVSQNYRFSPPVQKLKQMAQDEAAGVLGHGHLDFYIPADFTGSFRETMEFPLLVDMAIHHLDLIRCVTGCNIVRVTAQSFRPSWSWYQHDPGLKMLLELEGGVPFSYSGDWSARGQVQVGTARGACSAPTARCTWRTTACVWRAAKSGAPTQPLKTSKRRHWSAVDRTRRCTLSPNPFAAARPPKPAAKTTSIRSAPSSPACKARAKAAR